MITINKKDLMDYVFGPDGLGLEKKDVNEKMVSEWLGAQNEILENIKTMASDNPEMVVENSLGYVPYAIGDLQNLLQMMRDLLNK